MTRGASALVVGGAGFVGGNLVRRLLHEGVERVVVIDNLLSAEADNVPADARVSLREGSITDDALLAEVHDDFDHVFHLATYHGNESSIADPLADHANNLVTTLKLFERLKGFRRVRRIVYASTGCALAAKGDGPAEPVIEEGLIPLDFDSPYQISKVAGEMYARYYHRQHGLPVVRARFQNVYGPGETLGAGQWRGTPATIWRNVTPSFVYRALKGRALPVHGDGSSTRDFIYVDDIVAGLIRCATTDGVGGDVFNLASGGETTILEWAETINKLTANQAGIEHMAARTWDRSLHRYGSPVKSRARLGFAAQVVAAEGLARTVEWTRANLSRIEQCIARHRAHHAVDF
jgi:nucleoside-diphosphate-sugar epimerase